MIKDDSAELALAGIPDLSFPAFGESLSRTSYIMGVFVLNIGGMGCVRKTTPLILLIIKAVCFHVSLKLYLPILLLFPNLLACRSSPELIGITQVPRSCRS